MKKIITRFCVLCFAILSICCVMFQNDRDVVYAKSQMEFASKSQYLMDFNSKTVLYANNENARLPVASMVKLMTLLITFENLEKGVFDLNTKITTTENASSMGGSQVFIDPYVEYEAGDLIKSVIMASANDASVALAEFLAGSEQEFVSLMNNKAQQLNMENTAYANCTGLPAPEQYSCAKDCATLLCCLTRFDEYHKFSNVFLDTLTHPSGRQTELVNTNKLIRYYDGCDSGKTGSTNEAGFCLSASAKKDNMRLVCVVVGADSSKNRFKDASMLLNYGFANYENKKLISKDEMVVANLRIDGAKQKVVAGYSECDVFALCKKGSQDEYQIQHSINKIKAPLAKNSVVGKIFVIKDGNVEQEINMIVHCDVEERTIFDNIKFIASKM